MAVLGIIYGGGGWEYNEKTNERLHIIEPIKYESVYLHTHDEKHIFDSGDFIVDWYNANKKYYKEIIDVEPFLSHSSSVDHFIMDGAPYDSSYLHFENGMCLLKYVDDDIPLLLMNNIIEGSELFVEEGTKPTYEEYINKIKNGKETN